MLLTGKKILITGVANDWSMAWAIAKRAHEMGAEIAMPYAMPALEKRVRPLAESVGAKFVQECNVQNDEQLDDLFNKMYPNNTPKEREPADAGSLSSYACILKGMIGDRSIFYDIIAQLTRFDNKSRIDMR